MKRTRFVVLLGAVFVLTSIASAEDMKPCSQIQNELNTKGTLRFLRDYQGPRISCGKEYGALQHLPCKHEGKTRCIFIHVRSDEEVIKDDTELMVNISPMDCPGKSLSQCKKVKRFYFEPKP
jgi:hypothetical protein